MKTVTIFLIKLNTLTTIAFVLVSIIGILYPNEHSMSDDPYAYFGFLLFMSFNIFFNSLFRLAVAVRENILLDFSLGFIFSLLYYCLLGAFLNAYTLKTTIQPGVLIVCLPMFITSLSEPFLNRFLKRKFK